MGRIKKKLGDILLKLNLISAENLKNALQFQKENLQFKPLGEILLEKNLITKNQLIPILEYQLEIPYVDLRSYHSNENTVKLITEQFARKYRVFAFKEDFTENKIFVAMSDPLNIIAKDDIKLITKMDVVPFLSFEEDIEWAINTHYTSSEIAEQAVEEFQEEQAQQFLEAEENLDENEEVSRAPIVRLVNSLLEQAVKLKASDIHIEPFEKEVKIRLRIDGDLKEFMKTPKSSMPAIVARIKLMSGLDIAEKRIPQDGHVETKINQKPIDFRISILPTVHGEKIVLRILDRASVLVSKDKLGFTDYNNQLFEKLLSIPEGIVLLCGPTGSGKTTTLYAALQAINRPNINIITIEDPVEYRLAGINQVQVNNKAGLTFAAGLRSVLRQDPDVVLVGEIRDTETAEISVRAAITGHKVFSTIHTNDTVSTIMRLTDMGIERFLVASAVSGIVAQRLVKRICKHCKYTREATQEEKSVLKLEERSLQIAEGKGCNACGGSGFSGRIGIHEIFVLNQQIRSMINAEQSFGDIKRAAQKNGLKTLYESCKELVLNQTTTISELIRVAYSVDDI